MGWWRAYGPAMARPSGTDSLRGGIGAGLGLAAAAATVWLAEDARLIAPLGASAVMVFAIPNSPLAQPWSVVIGNLSATALALLLVGVLPAGPWVGPLVVMASLLTMYALRALHPPGGAMAFMVALGGTSSAGLVLGVSVLGSVTLVLGGLAWHWATGRTYPLRQPVQMGQHGTSDPAPANRTGLDPAELADILEDFRQSANLGVADLARLVGAVEQAAAARRMESFTAADIMSRDLVTVRPEAPLSQVADLFRQRGFTSLPVVDHEGRFLGVIFQLDLIRRAREDAFRLHRSLIAAFVRLIDDRRAKAPLAQDIMQAAVQRVTPMTPVGALLPMLSDGGAEAVPVVLGPQIVGIVTRSDLVSALAQRLAQS
jgi:CBS domain-containing membrane protein